MYEEGFERYLELCTERQRILQRRRDGQEWPWTDDEILQTYSFCNVYREDDRTTVWIRENLREPLRDHPNVLFGMVMARFFNRIETLEHISSHFIEHGWDSDYTYEVLQGINPVVTGAYMVNTPKGMTKLEGVLTILDMVWEDEPLLRQMMPDIGAQVTMERLHHELQKYPHLGAFMAYEMVTDLRHTFVLENAPDLMSWASPGPGCVRGLCRVMGVELGSLQYHKKQDRARCLGVMQGMLSKVNEVWPQEWPRWEMREVEHTLCEFDKYERVRLGEGRPKAKYRRPV